jgi:hypothetical protein
MEQVNQLRQDDSDAGRRAGERRALHALQGWVSSGMRRKARQRRNAADTKAGEPGASPPFAGDAKGDA